MAGYTGPVLNYRYAPLSLDMLQPRDFSDVLGEFTYGTINGTTKLQTASATYVPVAVPVVLIRDADLIAVRRTMSDAATGAYSFHGVPKEYTYTVMAIYPGLAYRAVLANGVTPT